MLAPTETGCVGNGVDGPLKTTEVATLGVGSAAATLISTVASALPPRPSLTVRPIRQSPNWSGTKAALASPAPVSVAMLPAGRAITDQA